MSRQYQNAARAVDSVLRNASSLQAHCASQARVGKTEYALACETLKFIHVIDNLFNVCGISAEKLDVDRGMLYVYTYELLFGKGKIQGGGVVKRRLMEQRALLEEALRKELRKQNAAGPQNLLDKRIQEFQQLPVYVRINRIKDPGRSSVAELEQLYGRCPMDQHIEDLVVLPPKTKGLGQLELVKSGILIIQDKASCMPSQILGDAWRNGDVVDACAAPGNKTSHIAAIINQRINAVRDMNLSPHPKIFAFDKSARRAELLGRRMTEAGADSLVECRNEDFTAIDIDDPLFSNVTAVLVDPSCSGSGVCRNLDRVVDRLHDADPALSETGGPASCTEDRGKLQHDRERLEQLRSFQVRAVLKALSFPHATTVVYSTCSIHEEENESVVSEVLKSQDQFVSNSTFGRWHLEAPPRMESWPRRGTASERIDISEDDLKKLIRCEPSDGLNGFFVALFCREKMPLVESTQELAADTKAESDYAVIDAADGRRAVAKTRLPLKRRRSPSFSRQSAKAPMLVPESQKLRLVLGL